MVARVLFPVLTGRGNAITPPAPGDHQGPPSRSPPPSPACWINPHSTTDEHVSKNPTHESTRGHYTSYAKWPKCGGSPLAKAQFLGYNCVMMVYIEEVIFF